MLGNTKVQDLCFNSRLQMTGLRVGDLGDSTCQSASGTQLMLGLGFGTGNNGNVASQSIQIGTTLSNQSYTYDPLNRLKTAQETTAGGATAWSRTYVYDRYGNRAILGTSLPTPATGIPLVTADDSAQVTALLRTQTDPVTMITVVTNQWLTSSVDPAGSGNVTAPVTGVYPNSLAYDGENRLVSAATGPTGTMSAAYDGEGRRVKKTVNGATTVFVYDAAGKLTQEYNGMAGPAGRQYVVADHLGSTRLTMNGTSVVHSDYYPFGPEVEAGTGDRTAAQGYQTKVVADADAQRVKFTGKERDAETGLDYFGARYMSSAQGRFTSPDVPLLDQNPGDPQSWNLYGYVRNNPLANIDPTGNDCVYVNSGGNGIDSVNKQNTSKDCGKTGGYWVDGTVTNARFAHGSLILTGTTNGENRTSASYGLGPDPGLLALQRGTQLAEPGVNLAAQGLMVFGSIVAPLPMALAQCGAGDCSKTGIAMAMLPELGALKAGGTVLKLGTAAGKGAEIIQKAGGAAQAAKDFAALGGSEVINGGVRIRTLSDGTRAILYTATSTGEASIAVQQAGRTVSKIRY